MWYNSGRGGAGHGCPMSMRHVRATNPEASYVLWWWWWWWWCVIYTCLDLNEMMKFCKRADTFAAILFHEVLFCHKMVCNECCKLDMIFFASLLSHVFVALSVCWPCLPRQWTIYIVFRFIIEFSSFKGFL